MSRDGAPRINLRVDVRLSLDNVATAIALANYEDAETISKAGMGRLLRWARDGMRFHGFDRICMGDTEGLEEEVDATHRRLVELSIFADPDGVASPSEANDGPGASS